MKSHRNSEPFPYTAEELAQYMQLLCNTMKPIVEDSIMSDEIEEELHFERRAHSRVEMIANGYNVAPNYEHIKEMNEDPFKDIN